MRPSAPPTRPRTVAGALSVAALAGTLAGGLAACGDGGTARDAGRDPSLDRDLTLAASTAAPPLADAPVLGDTAVARPAAAPPPRATAEPAPPAPVRRAPARPADATERPAPTRIAERPTPRPAPTREPAPPAPTPEPDPTPTPAPAAAPAPAPGPAPGLTRGTLLAATTASRVCSISNRPGDRLVATLSGAVDGPGGVHLPAGTSVVLEVVRVGDQGQVELLARGVSLDGAFHPIAADVAVGDGAVERRTVEGSSDAKGKAVKGAIAGAILGQILGRNTRGTVIGAATGAAAGAAAGAMSRREEVCLAAGAPVRIRLVDDVALR